MVHTNRLAKEKSPYLLQHQHNPVNWYPWGEEAFKQARALNRPIFLSIGYSTCHWCHVMERESFERLDFEKRYNQCSEEMARIMNASFVNIKVDREERPDVDSQYMLYVQATTGGGGWPMSVFLTPDLKRILISILNVVAFFGGTYFPPKDSFSMPGFTSILRLISENSGKVFDSLAKAVEGRGSNEPSSEERLLEESAEWINRTLRHFDSAPKFPTLVNIVFLQKVVSLCNEILEARDVKGHVLKPNLTRFCKAIEADGSNPREIEEIAKRAQEMTERTLSAIWMGGIHDHIGNGFHRYSVDRKWHLPQYSL
ncbi:hypothetical protein PSACC_03667 [Paramicrosporidium saccamoebae]|uniref:Spermatogenesis-associated protein 20-like TRX domain-containing protein n=1 Tax=Paramicrosporidium saccamoebae TaxID=1246581 RepID=A0A2H9TFL0_9FUNG|nr:hypothetical protein PSACC_03667 [Paramicrosporidium saccamoebae]